MHCAQFWPFSKSCHFSNIRCFFKPFFWIVTNFGRFGNLSFFEYFVLFEGVLCTEVLKMSLETFFCMFLAILIFERN